MQRLEVSGALRPIYGSLGVKRLSSTKMQHGDGAKIKFTHSFEMLSCCATVRFVFLEAIQSTTFVTKSTGINKISCLLLVL